jgi:hypothetical protein
VLESRAATDPDLEQADLAMVARELVPVEDARAKAMAMVVGALGAGLVAMD